MNVQGFQSEPLSREEFTVIARRRDMRGVSAIETRRLIATVSVLRAELLAVARLAADTPQFFNPLEGFAAQKIRDRVLAEDEATRSGLRRNDSFTEDANG